MVEIRPKTERFSPRPLRSPPPQPSGAFSFFLRNNIGVNKKRENCGVILFLLSHQTSDVWRPQFSCSANAVETRATRLMTTANHTPTANHQSPQTPPSVLLVSQWEFRPESRGIFSRRKWNIRVA